MICEASTALAALVLAESGAGYVLGGALVGIVRELVRES